MTQDGETPRDIPAEFPPQTGQLELPMAAWERLRRAREDAGKTVQQLAEETRIPRRMIETIESGDFSTLPKGPYAVGFARAMARALDLPDAPIAEEIRLQMRGGTQTVVYDAYEPVEPARIPSRVLAWTAALVAVAMIVGYGLWRGYGTDAVDMVGAAATTTTPNPAPADGARPAGPAPAPTNDAPLTVRASGDVWFGLNDETGRLVFERTLKAGETYIITAEQRGLTLRTGRPQNLRLVVGDRELPQLGPDDLLVRDVALTTAGLVARLREPTAAAAGTPRNADGATGGASPTPRPQTIY